MKQKMLFSIGGFVAGLVVMGLVVMNVMPSAMFSVHQSKFDVEKTVQAIKESAERAGWKVPKIYNFTASLAKDGYTDVGEMRVLSLCKADYAHEILKDEENRKITAMMPCRIGVFETSDGRVWIAGMNIGVMSRMFGGVIEEVMGRVAQEEARFLAPVIRHE
ncbi:DUF302 domain-containing protein [Deferrisoma palaeochoriense]